MGRAARFTRCVEDLNNGTVRVTTERPDGGSTIEVAPGVFDWDDYDRQFELAEKNGITAEVASSMSMIPSAKAEPPPLPPSSPSACSLRSR